MQVSKVYAKRFLNAGDVSGTQVTVIEGVGAGKVEKGNTGRTKLLLTLGGYDRQLVLNATNAKSLAAELGDETDKWIGQQVELYKDVTMFGGDLVDCLRLRAVAKPGAK